MTLQLLWQEYRQTHPDGYQRSRFCQLYRSWAKTLDPVLRQVHEPGQKMFVDWAGLKVPVQHADGSTSQASLFVAVLGFSNKTYAEAFANEQLEHWIKGHCQAFKYFGGLSRALVPDNPKTAVTRPCRYEPQLHRTYEEMANHYGTVILPARIKKPRDKAKVETGVQIAERQILAPLRDQRFFNVGEINRALGPLLEKLNAQPFQKLEGSRNSWFESQEKAALLPLPATAFELATWTKAKVNIDYHAERAGALLQCPLPAHSSGTGGPLDGHHRGNLSSRQASGGSPAQLLAGQVHHPGGTSAQESPALSGMDAQSVGGVGRARSARSVAKWWNRSSKNKPHPEMGYRSCLGIIRLGKGVGTPRLEAACARALRFNTCSYQSIKSILENGLDRQEVEPELPLSSPEHSNVRGQAYYA